MSTRGFELINEQDFFHPRRKKLDPKKEKIRPLTKFTAFK
jgi:hypothetical protein